MAEKAYSYFPGCAAKQVQKEADWAARAVCERLDITLHAMPKATCCGAVSLRESKPAFSLSVAARILSEAEAAGRDILTICNTCTQTLSHANYRFKNEPDLLDEINNVLKQGGVRAYEASIEVRHLAWVLTEEVGLEQVKNKISKPLNGMKVAPFYGCHNLRPSEIFATEKAGEKADHLDRLIEAMGGEPVSYDGRDKCCGFHIMLSDADEMRGMVMKNLESAKGARAEVMITPCTLCDMAMGAYQGIAEKTVGREVGLPEMNFAQLLGCAMGISDKKLGLNRLHVSPRAALVERGVL
ncbi:CoB--CoM heterodisulfide reductase iron-sulfur subunit B family protein [Magnetofaba australis]|uniref:Putative succinate dehydrogenase subunit C n=1 Tax=Magnetofaba australis IT-1 TaxID=1434232 RepID=A0A1Y2K077_9PROT|nr:CoB--CoM heterodisulfide reductase iron-sulfur subunit B family protein [Magnetofaba australis]OSM00143.1 putative succinate dehydrogenase subunit C [Magnetofaba australis IT-1]